MFFLKSLIQIFGCWDYQHVEKLSHDDRIFVSPLQVFEPCLFLESFHSCGKYTWACLIFFEALAGKYAYFKQNVCMHILSIKTVQEKLKTSKLHGPIKCTGMIRNCCRSNIDPTAMDRADSLPRRVRALGTPLRTCFFAHPLGGPHPWGSLAPPHAFHTYLMCNIWSTFKISRCNTCNIYLKTDGILETCVWSTCKKHLKTIANIRNMQIKHL